MGVVLLGKREKNYAISKAEKKPPFSCLCLSYLLSELRKSVLPANV